MEAFEGAAGGGGGTAFSDSSVDSTLGSAYEGGPFKRPRKMPDTSTADPEGPKGMRGDANGRSSAVRNSSTRTSASTQAPSGSSQRLMVRTSELLTRSLPSSAPEWVPARALQQGENKVLLRPEPTAKVTALLPSLPTIVLWVPLFSPTGLALVREMQPQEAEMLEEERSPPLSPGCLVDVEAEGTDSGWRNALVISRDAATRLYRLRLKGGHDDGRVVSNIRHSALRLRCCYSGCLKHALLMQRPPCDCDKCGRALQHPVRSFWEFHADMAEAIRIGITSAQLCSQCYKECFKENRRRVAGGLANGGSNGGEDDSAEGTVRIGTRDVPLCRFQEVPIRRRRTLQSEEPEDSEQQNWAQCCRCERWYHWVCALYNQRAQLAKQQAAVGVKSEDGEAIQVPPVSSACVDASCGWMCLECGKDRDDRTLSERERDGDVDSEMLPHCALSRQLEGAVAESLAQSGVSCDPVAVRVVSSIRSVSHAKESMVQRQWSSGEAYPTEFPYRSRALIALQKVDGREVILFMFYSQEYGSDCPQPNTRRVYISYVDSVRYFRSQPEGRRSTMYRALLCAYLRSCRERGFQHMHIWVEPPRAGDEYIFYARPPEERKPMKREKLRSWYCKMLERSKVEGVVQKYGGMLEEFRGITSARQIPLFKGDQWEITVPALLQNDGESEEAQGDEAGGSSSAAHVAGTQSMRAPTGLGSAARPQRLKGLQMFKSGSEDLVNKVQKQMRRLQGHFLVATFAPLDTELPLAEVAHDEENMSFEVVNSRQAMLHHCMRHALQFNSLRYAQYSTMMLIYEMLHPNAPPSGQASYCLPSCLRGRADDGSMMIACDVCDNWFHTGCLHDVPASDESFVCPLCVDAKTEYIEGKLSGECFTDLIDSADGEIHLA